MYTYNRLTLLYGKKLTQHCKATLRQYKINTKKQTKGIRDGGISLKKETPWVSSPRDQMTIRIWESRRKSSRRSCDGYGWWFLFDV